MAKKQSYLKQKRSFSGAQILIFVILFAAVGTVAVWQSLAAPLKGSKGGGSGGSLSLVMVTDKNSDGLPNLGDTVTFNLSTSASFPYVQVSCTQNGSLAFSQTNGFFTSFPWGQNYTLGPTSAWQSGGANCTARMFTVNNSRQTTLATTSFTVNP